MKNIRKYDEDLQKQLFEPSTGKAPFLFDEDEQYYLSIKKALESEPEVHLPERFAQTVTTTAIRRKRVQILLRLFSMYMVATVVIGISGGIAFYFLAGELFATLVKQLLNYKHPLLFGLAIFLLIQLFDEMFVKKRYWGRM